HSPTHIRPVSPCTGSITANGFSWRGLRDFLVAGHDRDGCRTPDDQLDVRWRLVDGYANWYPLRQAYPVECRRHVRQQPLSDGTVALLDGARDTFDMALKGLVVTHQLDLHVVSNRHPGELRLLEVADYVQRSCVDQRERRAAGIGIVPGTKVEVRDDAVH